MKKYYLLFNIVPLTVGEYRAYYNEIHDEFESDTRVVLTRIALTEEELTVFKLKYGNLFNALLLPENI